MRRDAHLWIIAGYLADNPVAAGLCDRPEAWRWSSHGALATGRAPRWLDHPRLEAYLDALGGGHGQYSLAVAQRRALAAAPPRTRPRAA